MHVKVFSLFSGRGETKMLWFCQKNTHCSPFLLCLTEATTQSTVKTSCLKQSHVRRSVQLLRLHRRDGAAAFLEPRGGLTGEACCHRY